MKLGLLLPLVLLMIAAQDAPGPAITSPRAGAVLVGQATISGTTEVSGFLSAQLDFAYASASQPAENWFLLQALPLPVRDSALFTWDTTAVTDGDYVLRLLVFLADGTTQEATVPVRIQNDSPLPTPTPVPTATPEAAISDQIPTPFLLAASPTPTDLPRPTPTLLPANPIALSQHEILLSLGRGALVIIGLFIFSGIAIRLRRS